MMGQYILKVFIDKCFLDDTIIIKKYNGIQQDVPHLQDASLHREDVNLHRQDASLHREDVPPIYDDYSDKYYMASRNIKIRTGKIFLGEGVNFYYYLKSLRKEDKELDLSYEVVELNDFYVTIRMGKIINLFSTNSYKYSSFISEDDISFFKNIRNSFKEESRSLQMYLFIRFERSFCYPSKEYPSEIKTCENCYKKGINKEMKSCLNCYYEKFRNVDPIPFRKIGPGSECRFSVGKSSNFMCMEEEDAMEILKGGYSTIFSKVPSTCSSAIENRRVITDFKNERIFIPICERGGYVYLESLEYTTLFYKFDNINADLNKKWFLIRIFLDTVELRLIVKNDNTAPPNERIARLVDNIFNFKDTGKDDSHRKDVSFESEAGNLLIRNLLNGDIYLYCYFFGEKYKLLRSYYINDFVLESLMLVVEIVTVEELKKSYGNLPSIVGISRPAITESKKFLMKREKYISQHCDYILTKISKIGYNLNILNNIKRMLTKKTDEGNSVPFRNVKLQITGSIGDINSILKETIKNL